MAPVSWREITEAIMAIIVVGGIVVIAGYDAVQGKPVTVPPELYGFAGIIIGAYFRGSSTVNGVATQLVTALKESSPPPAGPPAAGG
jgi:hypothetical protein